MMPSLRVHLAGCAPHSSRANALEARDVRRIRNSATGASAIRAACGCAALMRCVDKQGAVCAVAECGHHTPEPVPPTARAAAHQTETLTTGTRGGRRPDQRIVRG